jgi:hypothetical protein
VTQLEDEVFDRSGIDKTVKDCKGHVRQRQERPYAARAYAVGLSSFKWRPKRSYKWSISRNSEWLAAVTCSPPN